MSRSKVRTLDRFDPLEWPECPAKDRKPRASPRPAMSMTTWDALVRAEPSLCQFDQAAREAGRNRGWWWPAWIFGFGGFLGPLNAAAGSLSVTFAKARGIAHDHLACVFRSEWRRHHADEPPVRW